MTRHESDTNRCTRPRGLRVSARTSPKAAASSPRRDDEAGCSLLKGLGTQTTQWRRQAAGRRRRACRPASTGRCGVICEGGANWRTDDPSRLSPRLGSRRRSGGPASRSPGRTGGGEEPGTAFASAASTASGRAAASARASGFAHGRTGQQGVLVGHPSATGPAFSTARWAYFIAGVLLQARFARWYSQASDQFGGSISSATAAAPQVAAIGACGSVFVPVVVRHGVGVPSFVENPVAPHHAGWNVA